MNPEHSRRGWRMEPGLRPVGHAGAIRAGMRTSYRAGNRFLRMRKRLPKFTVESAMNVSTTWEQLQNRFTVRLKAEDS
jgi:hypothetical protein